MSALLPKADIRTVDLVVWHALQRKAFIRSRGAPLGDTRRLRPSARHYLVKRLAVDFENFDRSTGRSVVKGGDCKPAGVPRKRIKVGAVLFEDRPMYMLMMSMHDVAPAVAAVVTVWIDFSISCCRRLAHPAHSLDQDRHVRIRGAYRDASAVAVLPNLDGLPARLSRNLVALLLSVGD
jgi:hypothetical protein